MQQQTIQDKHESDCNIFEREPKRMKKAIADKNSQFKTHRINRKLEKVIKKAHTTPAPNQYEQLTGHTLMPLIEGKIQYHKLKKSQNLEQVIKELRERERVII